jgi:hypothetical protein
MAIDTQNTPEQVKLSLQFGPSYVDPSGQDYGEYFDHLVAYNRVAQSRLSRVLNDFCQGDVQDVSINTTGSDARLEKGPVSQVELLVLKRDSLDAYFCSEKLKDFSASYPEFGDDPEIKTLGMDSMAYAVLGRGSSEEIILLSPNRIFDARFLYGDEALFKEAKVNLVRELQGNESKSIFSRMKSKTRDHRKVTITGVQDYKGKQLVHYNPQTGIVYYNPQEKVFSFKQGPLRAVQFALVRDMIKGLRHGRMHLEELFDLPIGTVSKLYALEVSGKSSVPPAEVRDLADCYKYFLWQYHRSQRDYCENGTKERGFDTNEVKERLEAVDRICASNVIYGE